MPWARARNRYQCFRCKDNIEVGETCFFSGDNKKYYRYHAICKSISGRKEATMTKNLASFIKQVEKGPKMNSELEMAEGHSHSCLIPSLYRNCVMMGIPIYKHIFTSSGNQGKRIIYFMHKDRRRALKIVLSLCNNRQNYIKEHAGSILDKDEIACNRRGQREWKPKW